jgi:hypothetical protein
MLRRVLFVLLFSMLLAPSAYADEDPPNVILISFDGYQRNHLWEQLDAGEMPNLERLMEEGVYLELNQIDYLTQTKTAHAQMLSGYQANVTGVYANLFVFHPLPTGYTLLERAEDYFGSENVATGFISGKTHNIAPVFAEMEGVDYVSIMDEYLEDEVGGTGEKFLRFIDDHHQEHFVAFFHTTEPDKLGHLYGENSPEYHEGGLRCDRYLGLILDKLVEYGIMDETLVYVCTDHGFLEDGYSHLHEPLVWLVSNDLRLEANVDETRLFIPDIAATIYRSLGFDVTEPPLRGYPLQSPLPPEAEQRMVVWEDTEPPELKLEYTECLEPGEIIELDWTVSDDLGLTKTYVVTEMHGVEYFNGSVGEVLYESAHIAGLEAELSCSIDLPLNQEMYDITVYAFDERENLSTETITVGTDRLLPRIESASLSDGQTIYDDYNLCFILVDNVGLSYAEMLFDGETVEVSRFIIKQKDHLSHPLHLSGVPNGAHTVFVYVEDVNGNILEETYTLIVDKPSFLYRLTVHILVFFDNLFSTFMGG